MPYIHFTEEQKSRAASVDLEEFLRLRGEELIRSGGEKRMASNHSITIRGNEWYDHADQHGGGPISFVQDFYGLNYPEAVTLLLNGENGVEYPTANQKGDLPPKPFELPPANSDNRRVYAYLLKQRNIDREVISHFVKAGLLYEDAKYHNCVFVGMDGNEVPRHAHKRSTNSFGSAFRINVESSDPKYCFHHIGEDDQLYVFEAPIDMLSYITLHMDGWEQHSYVACCGTSSIHVERDIGEHITLHMDGWEQHSYVACCGTSSIPVLNMLDRLPQLQQVFLCLDNDEAGHTASRRMAELLDDHGIRAERLTPEQKDWNEDLVLNDKQEEVYMNCQMSGY